MGKPKVKRKSTLIDMTAMSDVTVLLLTFFMLTSTFLAKEPATVITPSSVSEIKVPLSNLVTILVSGAEAKSDGTLNRDVEGKVFLGITGDEDSIYSSEKVRRDLLVEASKLYNERFPNAKVNFTQAQVAAFSKLGMFGMPMKDLPAFLDLPTTEQDKIMKEFDPKKVGIPIDDNRDVTKLNEFQIWMDAMQRVAQDYKNNGTVDGKGEYAEPNPRFYEAIKRTGEGIAVKGDKDTPYSVMHTVLDNLQTLKLNKFSLMTALKSENE
ncbi:MAG: biopolymer transporter ExbD [Bacteroides sp.]|nr:biopolymer transporter ExbD [Bacteroides sp.]MCM1379765.1 biopolymer transporter ExbD [Bacteroides sp.]MCM1445694.1 biopolymer transporter ExbD [Prevotella sp.]